MKMTSHTMKTVYCIYSPYISWRQCQSSIVYCCFSERDDDDDDDDDGDLPNDASLLGQADSEQEADDR
jgi:hypothetical protein